MNFTEQEYNIACKRLEEIIDLVDDEANLDEELINLDKFFKS
jgi:hypothetical protein